MTLNVEAKKKALKALDLRSMGVSWEQIAESCGYNTPQAAIMAVKRLIAKRTAEGVDDLRARQNNALDLLLKEAWHKAKSEGDTRAMDIVLKAMDRQARLNGLDAPQKADITSGGKELLAPADLIAAILKARKELGHGDTDT